MTKLRLTSVAGFAVHYLRFINADGELTQTLPSTIDHDQLIMLYEKMLLTRMFDQKAINLQRTGQLGTYPPSLGQEAIGAGIGFAIKNDDILCPYYRDHATFFMRGINMRDVLSYWGGDERGSAFENGSVGQKDFPICVPIAGQALHAAGSAFAIKYRGEAKAVVTTIGEGGTSKGDYYEAMNLAGEWNLPIVFVVNNNQWAISTRRDDQTACKTIAQKAFAAGFEGIQVDGNDVAAMSYVMNEALEKARSGKGPTLVEAISFRLCDHTTADDATRYIPDQEMKDAWNDEPIKRLRKYLESQKLWSEKKEEQLQEKLTQDLNKIVKDFLERPKPKATDMFDYLYETLPADLNSQRAEVERLYNGK